jgi:hypothetical protein
MLILLDIKAGATGQIRLVGVEGTGGCVAMIASAAEMKVLLPDGKPVQRFGDLGADFFICFLNYSHQALPPFRFSRSAIFWTKTRQYLY